MFEKISNHVQNGRGIITISNPPENRLTEEIIHNLTSVIEDFKHTKDVKLVVLRSGVGGVFSHGFEPVERSPEKIGTSMAAFSHLLYVMNDLPMIVVCEVDGPCFGASLELAMFCDILVASDSSEFGHPEISHGVFPPIAAALYPHTIGRNRTIELLATGRKVKAEEAYQIGLVNRVLTSTTFAREIEWFYKEILKNSAITLKMMKKAVEAGLYQQVTQAIQTTENVYLNELMRTHDAQEGVAAAIEGRVPVWKDE
jgi:cyclohexa-1,5-dienecarbonyl-CoA hydratase